MRLVLDASVVLPFVAATSEDGNRIRPWLIEQLSGSVAHVVHTLTHVQVLNGLAELEASGEVTAAWASHVQRRSVGWPFARELLTQTRSERVWELRTRFTAYQAAYVALTESLSSEYKEVVALCTADEFFIGTPLPCTILAVPDFT